MGLLGPLLGTDDEAEIDSQYSQSGQRTFRGYFSTDCDAVLARNLCGIAPGDSHPNSPRMRVIGVSAKRAGETTVVYRDQFNAANANNGLKAYEFTIGVNYGLINPLEFAATGNPVDMPTRFSFKVTTVNQPAFEDVDGDPIVNSAGDYYDPPVERETPRVTLTVHRNESSPDPSVLLALANVVNAAPWNGFPAKTVKLSCPEMPEVQYSQGSGSFYWPMEYVFEINFDTWVKQVLNRGYRELDADGKLALILDSRGQPISDPMFLDEDGHKVLTPDYLDSSGDVPPDSSPGGSPGEVPGGGEPPEGGTGAVDGVVVNAYDMYRTFDFSLFNMDTLFTLPAVGP